MKQRTKQFVTIALGLLILGLIFGAGVWLILAMWRRFSALNPDLTVGLITAVSTVLVATLTITLGRYYERKKEVEAHFRDKKSGIYDGFLKEFFNLYYSKEAETIDLVPFLREWQRQAILWGGPGVVTAFLNWSAHLKNGVPDAQSMFLMEDFFRALRHDLGLSNWGLQRGTFIRLILKHPHVFLSLANENPNVTLIDVAKREKELGLSD